MKSKKVVSSLLAIALIFTAVAQNTQELSEPQSLSDEKIFSNATLEGDFTDDIVILTMTRQASLDLRRYEINDFPEVRLREVRSLSTSVEANVRVQLLERQIEKQNSTNSTQHESTRDRSWDVNVEEFRQIISLTLREPGKEKVLNAIKILERRDDVFAAEPNWVVKPGTLNNMRTQAATTRVNLPQAWDITTGSANITVGIMDTGIDGTHPDLAGRLHPANSNLHGDFTGSSISPLVDHGFPHSSNGHGTHVAGIVGPMCAWNVRLASLRVFSTVDGLTNLRIVLDAIDHAILRNITMLNLSSNGFSHSAALEQRIRNYNGLFVISAGNRNLHLTSTSDHIGRASIPNLIVVGASAIAGNNEWRAEHPDFGWAQGWGSNWGAAVVDVFAPGTGILSAVPASVNSSRYISWSGTSMAAPIVSGLAALLKSYNNNLSNDDIKQIIRLSADNVPAGFGRINAGRALALVRDNQLWHWTATGGTTFSSTGHYTITFNSVPGLATGSYNVRRHEVRRTATFSEPFQQIAGEWERSVGNTGWSMANPNYGRGFTEIVSSTSSSVTLRTYVYEVWRLTGQSLGWHPTRPENVTFAYTVLGNNCNINFSQTVTTNTTVTSCGTINAQNTTVTPTGALNLKANTINIGPGFTVQSGGSLTIEAR
jgi:subtilisin family serine protease